jgi:hypothetical protein
MRLWSLHPKYLDAVGLVSVWRKALLAREVLRGKTRGYRSHPQLERFRAHASPLSAINAYLAAVYEEAADRGYEFDRSKLGPARSSRSARSKARIPVTKGQLAYEWKHLRAKLLERCQEMARRRGALEPHPLFRVVEGRVEAWERKKTA